MQKTCVYFCFKHSAKTYKNP